MNRAALMAVRIQDTLDDLASAKSRLHGEETREQRLTRRLTELFGPILDHLDSQVRAHGSLPSDEGVAALLIGDIDDLGDELLVVLLDETTDVAVHETDRIARLVGRDLEATKASRSRSALEQAAGISRQLDRLRPFGMDRKLFAKVERLGGKMLTRFTAAALDAMVATADVELSAAELRTTLAERLEGELMQLSRRSIGDVRNETTTEVERELGVEFHRWVTANDERTRPAHAEVHGEIARVGQRFSNGWLRPGGLGCRCYLEPVVDQPTSQESP